MKRLLAAAVLLALLAGCAGRSGTADDAGRSGTADDAGPEVLSAGEEAPEGLTMELERAVYDPSVTRYTYFIRNNSEERVEFGEPYWVQRWSGSRWTDLTARENYVFTAIGYSLEPGQTMALTCGLGMYQEEPRNGRYRLVKDVGDYTLYAEFQLGESVYTADQPYGFGWLEDLPEPYGAAQASEADVVLTKTGPENLAPAEEFLFKAGLGASCQLRVVWDQGAPAVTDVIYENDHFLVRTWEDGEITEERFSYLVTDGRDVYLSNGVDWDSGEKYGDGRRLLLPEAPAEIVAAVERRTADCIYGNITRFWVWSEDGVRSAGLSDMPTEFSVREWRPGKGGWGQVFDLQSWDGPETAVLGVRWLEDGTLELKCETAEGGISRRIFDPETKQLRGTP